MSRTWEIKKTEEPGGGWLLIQNDPSGLSLVYAFRTLDSARNYVASVVQVEKRVRFTKLSDSQYSYRG